MKQQIKTGDTVKIISGISHGQSGKVLKVAPKKQLVYVEGFGNITRHLRPTQRQKGGKKDIHVGIHVSNLKLEKAADQTKKKEKKS